MKISIYFSPLLIIKNKKIAKINIKKVINKINSIEIKNL